MDREYWYDKGFSYISNRECEYYPCHATDAPEDFNCLFCYCPLYWLGKDCGGNFTYTEKGIKNCVGCLIPHKKDNYGYIVEKVTQRLNSIV
jgi:Zn-finger protein